MPRKKPNPQIPQNLTSSLQRLFADPNLGKLKNLAVTVHTYIHDMNGGNDIDDHAAILPPYLSYSRRQKQI